MEKLGVLLSCMSVTLVAMEDAQSLRDMVAQHAQHPLVQVQEPEVQEVPTCVICFEDMVPAQNIIHTQCTDELHVFHTPCLAQWYAKTDQPKHKKCPTCSRTFKSATKKILENEKRKMRAVAEEANPRLRSERENKEKWARFFHFTALGLIIASVAGIPLVLKEYAYGPGPRGPIGAECMSIIVPTTVTVALPLEQHANRLEEEID